MGMHWDKAEKKIYKAKIRFFTFALKTWFEDDEE